MKGRKELGQNLKEPQETSLKEDKETIFDIQNHLVDYEWLDVPDKEGIIGRRNLPLSSTFFRETEVAENFASIIPHLLQRCLIV